MPSYSPLRQKLVQNIRVGLNLSASSFSAVYLFQKYIYFLFCCLFYFQSLLVIFNVLFHQNHHQLQSPSTPISHHHQLHSLCVVVATSSIPSQPVTSSSYFTTSSIAKSKTLRFSRPHPGYNLCSFSQTLVDHD